MPEAGRPLTLLDCRRERRPIAALAVAVTTPSTAPVDPARDRGLRRARALAACPPVEPTPLPAAVEQVHLLALLTRVRALRVAAGEFAPDRLYDLAIFKCCLAELAYLRRLAAAGRAGGTVVTSMRQLVAGLAALHPNWKITGGDGYEDRDRHHSAVRRRLHALQAMGLLRWRIGRNLDGEERRTELELQPTPDVSVEELHTAARQLERWHAKYGLELNTGSKTGIRNAASHGRPLSASERQRRGVQHTRAVAVVRRRSRAEDHFKTPNPGSLPTAPPFGASAMPKNDLAVSTSVSDLREVCQRTGVTRANAPVTSSASGALGDIETGGGEGEVRLAEGGSAAVEGAVGSCAAVGGDGWDPEALIARVKAREAQRAPVLAAIAKDAQARAIEVADWGLERAWPSARLREAWLVARYGAMAAADSGPAGAGPLGPEDYARLRRAVARYERNHAAAPDGYPAAGLAALLHIGATATERRLHNAPRTLRYAIGALDHLARRMRAIATADSARRHQAAARRAEERRQRPQRAEKFAFRIPGWPAWILTPGHDEPRFERGALVLDERNAARAPAPHTSAYRTAIRDAYLLAGQPLPLEVDGRRQMALRHTRQLEPAQQPERPGIDELELRELAHRTGEPLTLLRRLSPTYRQAWLNERRQSDAAQARADTAAFRQQLADLHNQPHKPAPSNDS
ncbi:MAG: hypothetical protein ACLP50_08300 [Solirubrobacteraceae bacterium]